MSLMSKNKPTKRISFEGGFVELQHLPKGVKSEYQSRMAGLLKDMGNVNLNDLKNDKEKEIPEDINVDGLLSKINQAEYYKLSKAIKSWSEEEDITELTVQELDEDVFAKISEAIDEMNELSTGDKKN
jgi:hypothetical protein